MKEILKNVPFLFLIIGLLFLGCNNGESPTSPGLTWQTFFEDHFDGDTLNTNNWTQIGSSPAPYSLTGSGELKIDGESVYDEEGARFVYKNAISGNYVRVSTKFRTTQNNPFQDNVDIAIILNADLNANNYYVLLLTSDPIGNIRDYTLSIIKSTNGVGTELKIEYMGGTTPQITADNNYILEGVNNNGTIIFKIKDDNGNTLKSISIEDSSYSGGKVAFGGDLNIGTTGSQSIFFDYIRIEKYE